MKKYFIGGKNISIIFLEAFTNSLKKLSMTNKTSYFDALWSKNLTHFGKQLKAEKLQSSTKYLLKYERQENLTSYFFDYATLGINKVIDE